MHLPGTVQVEQVADRAGPDGIGGIPGNYRPGHRVSGRGHGELAELLSQGHVGNECPDPIHVIHLPLLATTIERMTLFLYPSVSDRSKAAKLSDNVGRLWTTGVPSR
jgi:hypothetical protein